MVNMRRPWKTESDTRRYKFGPCPIHGLRKLRTFFQNASLGEASLGFDTLIFVAAMCIVRTMATVLLYVSRTVA
jgi:hypothetical protein